VRRLEEQGVTAQGPLAAALLARCQGIVTDDDPDARFAAALEHHVRVPSPFEQARTILAWGERRRRDRRVGDARGSIEDAAEMFVALGATPWVQRANAELEAEGKLAPATPKEGCHSLTPQERRVAVAVSSGATNRDVAASLFLSPRTVEHHVANLFRKLGVRSRSELTRVVLTDPGFVECAEPDVGHE
jgi:DNA-binding CsgD family transcriptional regulator